MRQAILIGRKHDAKDLIVVFQPTSPQEANAEYKRRSREPGDLAELHLLELNRAHKRKFFPAPTPKVSSSTAPAEKAPAQEPIPEPAASSSSAAPSGAASEPNGEDGPSLLPPSTAGQPKVKAPR